MKLEDIKITIENDNTVNDQTALVPSLLQELLTMIKTFVQSGEEGIIDLNGLPLLPQTIDRLKSHLGKGEVSVMIKDQLGETEVFETSFSGIWWISYKDYEQNMFLQQIEVTDVPELLKTHIEDIQETEHSLEVYLKKI